MKGCFHHHHYHHHCHYHNIIIVSSIIVTTVIIIIVVIIINITNSTENNIGISNIHNVVVVVVVFYGINNISSAAFVNNKLLLHSLLFPKLAAILNIFWHTTKHFLFFHQATRRYVCNSKWSKIYCYHIPCTTTWSRHENHALASVTQLWSTLYVEASFLAVNSSVRCN